MPSLRTTSAFAALLTGAILVATAIAAPPPAAAPASPAPKPAITPAPIGPPAPATPNRSTSSTARPARPAARPPKPAAPAAPTAPDTSMTLRGGQEGTVFRTLTVEGEDRVRIVVERPTLALDLDPEQAPGLDPGGPRDILDRTRPDLASPLLATTAREPSPYLGHPWLGRFAEGAVARFRPEVKGIERWRLVVADSRGEPVARFEGRGDAPREIPWDGRTTAGTPAVPGLTYSYVFEAYDRAGNKRNFVGKGFQVPPYLLASPGGTVLVFSGRELGDVGGTGTAVPPILVEAASRMNHLAAPGQRLRVTVAARGFEQANAMATQLGRQLTPLLIGDPARVTCAGVAEPGAPESGTVRIEAMR